MPAVSWPYTALMVLSIAATALLLRRSQASLPLSPALKWALGSGAFAGAMIGAKLPFWIAGAGGTGAWSWLSHGKTIMAGIAGGYLGVEIVKWAYEIRVKTGDTFAFPVAVGVAIGRLACFAAGCCHGQPTNLPWGVCFSAAPDGGSMPRHPTQLYEFFFHASAAALLYQLGRRGAWRGQLIKAYLLAYLAYRFASEWLRPEPLIVGRAPWGLTAYQLAALALAPILVALWVRDARQARGAAELSPADAGP